MGTQREQYELRGHKRLHAKVAFHRDFEGQMGFW